MVFTEKVSPIKGKGWVWNLNGTNSKNVDSSTGKSAIYLTDLIFDLTSTNNQQMHFSTLQPWYKTKQTFLTADAPMKKKGIGTDATNIVKEMDHEIPFLRVHGTACRVLTSKCCSFKSDIGIRPSWEWADKLMKWGQSQVRNINSQWYTLIYEFSRKKIDVLALEETINVFVYSSNWGYCSVTIKLCNNAKTKINFFKFIQCKLRKA